MWKNGYPCRCPKCWQRKTLALRPDEYSSRQQWRAKCKRCKVLLRVDQYRLTRENKKYRCDCGWYPFPHAIGSLWCFHGDGGRARISWFERGTEYALHWRQGFIHFIGGDMDLSVISRANRQLTEAQNPTALLPVIPDPRAINVDLELQLGQQLLQLDRVAQHLGIDLGTAAVKAVNRESANAGLPIRIELERAA